MAPGKCEFLLCLIHMRTKSIVFAQIKKLNVFLHGYLWDKLIIKFLFLFLMADKCVCYCFVVA